MEKRRLRTGFTLVELLVVIAIIGILMGLLFPAIQSVRTAAQRTSCINNVKQISLAILNYESAHLRLPPGVVDNDNDHRDGLHSGLVYILPYIEKNNAYSRYDRDVAWSAPENADIISISVAAFLCPANEPAVTQSGGIVGQPTDYAFCKGDLAYLSTENEPVGIFDINSETRTSDIRDGQSNTIMIGEAASNRAIDAKST